MKQLKIMKVLHFRWKRNYQKYTKKLISKVQFNELWFYVMDNKSMYGIFRK